jgi:predicted permease
MVAVGRLAPGVDMAQAEAEANTLLAAFRTTTPDVPADHGVTVAAVGRLPPSVRTRFASFLGLLLAFAGALLAIACSNVAGMQLARATTRHREVATRLALGASRWQIVRLMLVETALVYAAASVVAIPLTVGLLTGFEALLPALPLPIQLDLTVSYRTMLAGGAVALVTSLLFGLAPARHTLRLDLSPMLHGRSSTDAGRRLRLRHALLVGQMALALTLVTTAGLFVRALHHAAVTDVGFDARDVAIVTLDLAAAGITSDDRITQTTDAIVERLAFIEGVQAVGYARMVPLFSGSLALGGIRVPGRADADQTTLRGTNWDAVSPGYFAALRLPLAHGRPFTDDDREGRPAVAIVNETFARLAWPGQSAVGQQFWQTRTQGETPQPDRLLQVVGVARDAKSQTIDEAPRPFVYVPFAQHPQTHVELFVRHISDRAIGRDIRPAIGAIAPDVPVVSIHRFEDSIAGGVFPQRLAAWTAGLVGVSGILLAGLGLYGLVSFVAAQRARELAIRLALGARRAQVAWLVASQALVMTAVGTTAGLLAAWMLGRVLQSGRLLLGVPAADPLAFAGAATTLLLVVLAGCYRPLRHAMTTDPALALRGE